MERKKLQEEAEEEEKQLKRKQNETERDQRRREKEVKQLKRKQEETERDQRRREKEVKQLKRKQEQIERDQRRLEKQESEQKKRRSLQKQASIMEKFLHKSKNPQSRNDAIPSSLELSRQDKMHEFVTASMDSALLQKERISIEELRKSHFKSWHRLGNSIRSRSGQHWGLRRKPKIAFVKDLKLRSSHGTKQEEDLNTDSMVDDQACNSNINFVIQKCRRTKQLLQFHENCRPAFYGVWPKMSNIVRPRNPHKQDPELDYVVDSDEEWEEEEPGESLSECDKDEEENLEEGLLEAEDGEENEDGFIVPDGYLSENEGVQSARSPCRVEEDEAGTSSKNDLETESVHSSSWVLQIKHLQKLTEHTLKKNQPLIVTNMKHERADLLCSDNLTVELHSEDILIQEDQEASVSTRKNKSLLAGGVKGIPDSELLRIVAAIESFPYSMRKVCESLLQKFPNCSNSQLESKVRQISDFVDNKWQVKKSILDQLGLSKSPEKSGSKMKSISTFFSKWSMLPSDNGAVQIKPSLKSSQKTEASQEQQPQVPEWSMLPSDNGAVQIKPSLKSSQKTEASQEQQPQVPEWSMLPSDNGAVQIKPSLKSSQKTEASQEQQPQVPEWSILPSDNGAVQIKPSLKSSQKTEASQEQQPQEPE